MPGKSRRAKALQHKRRKERRLSPAIAVQQQVVAQTRKPVASAPSVSAPTPRTTLTAARYPYITAELRRIGILAGIMLVILIVLALVLS